MPVSHVGNHQVIESGSAVVPHGIHDFRIKHNDLDITVEMRGAASGASFGVRTDNVAKMIWTVPLPAPGAPVIWYQGIGGDPQGSATIFLSLQGLGPDQANQIVVANYSLIAGRPV